MNEKHVTFLIKQIRNYLEELESEVRNHPENYVLDDKVYSELQIYSEWNDDDGYPD